MSARAAPDTATSVRTSAKPAFRFSFIIVFLGLDKRVPTPGKRFPVSPVWLTTYRDYIDIVSVMGKRETLLRDR
ncbi:hypothetical protein NL304_25730, partial [Klebsiella pneumoniae]|jgi:hypothetical protein|nr:hypothetical protein [Klebsiella pneumoniae]